ncbi:hypothetical protein [Paraflavitalea pollutisoli]|uniref:hypothetical protein n=1 Tax=Paraflavitalea pollutisoli TaxID=3034143 RepID=UPI0023EDE5CD|nr:hypothetical protein [Paraflavitalea sp. H1-2-19X]
MKQRIVILLSSLMLVLVMTQCKKGDTGPQGPAGPQGPQGPVGTPNVIYSEWFTATPWIKDTVFGIWGFKYNKPVPAITQPVLDSGVVLVYGKLLGYNPAVWPTTQVAQLPILITYLQSGKTQTDTWSGLATPGNLRIRFVNNTNEYNVIATQHQFRYIVLPGGKKDARVAQLTYAQVCKMYRIPE